MRVASSWFVWLWLVAPVAAQPWNDLRARTTAIAIDFRLVDPHPFHQGERISVEWKLPVASQPGQTPPQEMWQLAGFLLDPAGECGAVVKPCFLHPRMGGIIAGGPAGASPLVTQSLNPYLPALAPGRYRTALLARKLVLTSQGLGMTTYGYNDPPQYAVSATVEFEITPVSPAWIAQTVARCIALLNGPPPANPDADRAQREAAEQLVALNDPAAWAAALEALSNQEGILLSGLQSAIAPGPLCDLMQARIPLPAQSVSRSYLTTMTELCAAANLPPAPSANVGPRPGAVLQGRIGLRPAPAAPVAQPDPAIAAWLSRRSAHIENLMAKATASLAATLPAKQDEARWTAFATLLEHLRQLRSSQLSAIDPAWAPALSAEFVRAVPQMDAARKRYLLDLYNSVFDSPEAVALLESVLDAWKPGDYYEAAHSAIHALSRIDPARAQRRILSELIRPATWLDVASLQLLPPSAVSNIDDALIEALVRAQRPGGWNAGLSSAAIARYASPAALAKIKGIYESQEQQPCQPELVAYFVRVAPAYADRIFRSHPWDMHVKPPACTVQYFLRTAPLAMSAPLEQYLAAYLMHGEVYIKTTAVIALGRYGTPTALPKLWDTLRYFHEYWKGKDADLAQNGEGIHLEVELRSAIAHGRGWLATDADLKRIQSLCISGSCIDNTRQDLEAWNGLLSIELTDQPDGISGRVAQYFGLENIEAIEAKLAQFPRGIRFSLRTSGPFATRSGAEIRRFAADHGLAVDPQ